MATDAPPIPELLASLTSSLESSAAVLPNAASVLPQQDGLSLLDVKNDMMLSYLQHLTYLLLLKLRGFKNYAAIAQASSPKWTSNESLGEDVGHAATIQEPVVKRLVGLRLYLEKGVKPLEGRLQYQLDKVIRAAEDAERAEARHIKQQKVKKNRLGGAKADMSTHMRASHGDATAPESDSTESDGESDAASADRQSVSDLAYRPNPAAFGRPRPTTPARGNSSKEKESGSGVYRPPRITPMAPPELQERRQRQRRHPHKSATLDEFVADELSAAPNTEASIGSTIVKGGRGIRTAKDRQREAQRREYEEANFVRLPKQSKKEMAQQRRREGTGFGGEDWGDLDRGLDRITSLTKRGTSANLLERSRKRKLGDGETVADMGATWERRKRAHRKKG